MLIGDLLDLDPPSVLALHTRGRELLCLQILAPVELSPPPGRGVEWLDPEGTDRLPRTLDAAALRAYEQRLEACLAVWDRLATRHGFSRGVHPSDRPFEDVVRAALGA